MTKTQIKSYAIESFYLEDREFFKLELTFNQPFEKMDKMVLIKQIDTLAQNLRELLIEPQ